MFNDKDLEKYHLIKGKQLKPCMMCKKETQYIDFLSEGYVCSKECMDEFYDLVNKNECRNDGEQL